MNLFGFNISWNGKNGKFVKQAECHKAQDTIKDRIDIKILEVRDDISSVHKRIDEIFNILLQKK